MKTHGHAPREGHSPTYERYHAMIQRCTNEKHASYPLNGGKGIKVCDRWLQGFKFFLIDMGECPDGGVLQRRDTDADYTKDNCFWGSSRTETRTTNKEVTVNGATYPTIKAAADAEGFDASGYRRLTRRIAGGMSVEEAFKK